MKAAFWGIALIVIGALGVVLIDLFGNITVTNQLNYTSMKNAVEASMYDAVNKKYLSGFCLCTNREKDANTNKYVFYDKSEYSLLDVTYVNGQMTCKPPQNNYSNCELLIGEHRIDKEAFAESFVRRFAEMVNNNKSYKIVFQEIIEYPPKVSVRVSSYDSEFLPVDKANGYTIVNQIDSIIETKDDYQCYYKEDAGAGIWDYCWGDSDSCGPGYVLQPNVTRSSCVNVCYCQKDGTRCGIWAKKNWTGYDELKDSNGNNITELALCKKKQVAQQPTCASWHYNNTQVICHGNNGKVDVVTIEGKGDFSSCQEAYRGCEIAANKVRCESGERPSFNCIGRQTIEYSCSIGAQDQTYEYTCNSSGVVNSGQTCNNLCKTYDSESYSTKCQCKG